jgi:FkbM family methyltransferase
VQNPRHEANFKQKTLSWFVGQQLSEWVDFHRHILHGIWHRIQIRSSGGGLVWLYNFRSMLGGRPVRTAFDQFTGRAFVTGEGFEVEVFPQQRITNYAKGIVARAERLGKDYLLEHIDFKDGDIVIDCGANVGDFNLYFRSKNIRIEYVGIEPGQNEFAVLQRNVAPATAYNLGLWHDDGELTFYVSSKHADSSLIEPPQYDSVAKVPIRRLDKLVDFPRIRLFKVEAEGAEPEVLEGAKGLFSRIDYISADLGGERGVEQTSTFAPVTNFLLNNGFELVDVNHTRVVGLFINKSLRNKVSL